MLKTKSADNIQKVVVSGYELNMEKMTKVDLIADRYIGKITLDEPRENNDLLEKQRTQQIIALHEKSLKDLEEIFGRNG